MVIRARALQQVLARRDGQVQRAGVARDLVHAQQEGPRARRSLQRILVLIRDAA